MKTTATKFYETEHEIGFVYIFLGTSKVLKLCWVMVFIFCLSMLIYETYSLSIDYRTNPTATKVKKLHSTSFEYPPMMLCPNVWFNETKIHEQNLSIEAFNYALGLLAEYEMPFTAEGLRNAEKEFNRSVDRNDLFSFFVSFALDSDQVIPYRDVYKVWPAPVKMISFGACYEIKLKPMSTTTVNWYPPFIGYKRQVNKTLDKEYHRDVGGDVLLVVGYHENDTFLKQSLGLRDHAFYSLAIEPALYARVNRRQEPCYEQLEYFYSKAVCLSDCEEQVMRDIWGCTYFGYFIPANFKKNFSMCRYVDQTVTISDVKDQTAIGRYNSCIEHCHDFCEEWDYKAAISKLASDAIKCEERKYDIVVRLQYDVYSGITVYEEVLTYTWVTAISNFGGLIGLWLNASIVCLFKFIHFIVDKIKEKSLIINKLNV